MLLSILVSLAPPTYAFDFDAVMDRAIPTYVSRTDSEAAGGTEIIGFSVGAVGSAAVWSKAEHLALLDRSPGGLTERRAMIAANRATRSMDRDIPGYARMDGWSHRPNYAKRFARLSMSKDPELIEVQRQVLDRTGEKLPKEGRQIWINRLEENFEDPEVAKKARLDVRRARLGTKMLLAIPVYSGLSLLTRLTLDRRGGIVPLPSIASEMVKEAYSDLEPHLPAINVSFESGE